MYCGWLLGVGGRVCCAKKKFQRTWINVEYMGLNRDNIRSKLRADFVSVDRS
jgi:hypothetical protein